MNAVIEVRPERDQLVYTFGGAAPLRHVQPGSVLDLWSEDAFNNVLSSVDDRPSQLLDPRYLNPQTGPFYVDGAEPGDTLVLHVADLRPARNWGASTLIPLFGGLTGTDRTALLQEPLPEQTWIYDVDTANSTVVFHARHSDLELALPMAPMLGTVGVAPAGGEVRSSLVPDRFGGNMDTPEMRAGTTVYLGVNQPGALFSIGDGHYRQGEGESCGTAVEGAMHSRIIVELIRGGAPAWPRLEDDTHWMAVGSTRPLEDAWRVSQVEMIAWLGELYGLHRMDAYQLLTQIALSPIANVVDANYSAMTKVSKSLLPSANAYDGTHQRLRELARTLA